MSNVHFFVLNTNLQPDWKGVGEVCGHWDAKSSANKLLKPEI